MWLASSDEQHQPILCDRCCKQIDSAEYIQHWKNCNNAEVHKNNKKTNIINIVQNQSQLQSIQCPYCRKMLQLNELDSHQQNDCQLSKVQCQKCKKKINMQQFDQHQRSCNRPVQHNRQAVVYSLEDLNMLHQNIYFQQFFRNYLQAADQENNGVNNEQIELSNSLFQGLKNIGKGMKKQEIKLIPIVKFKPEENQHNSCAICQQDYLLGQNVMKLRCNHIYHKNCSQDWLIKNSSCPICKSPLKQK